MKARLVLAAFLSMGVMVFSLSLYGESWGTRVGAEMEGEAAVALRGLFRLGTLALAVPVLLLLGAPLLQAVVRMRRFLSAESLVLAGVGAAFAVSVWNTFTNTGEVYFETATMVLVLVSLGRWLESHAKVRASERLHSILPERLEPARRVDGDGSELMIDAETLRPGDTFRVRPGETFPADGIVKAGRAFVDTATLTGEEEPRAVAPGSRVLAGTSSTDGVLLVEATATGKERVLERAQALLDQSLRGRGRTSVVADRAAAWLLPLVLVLAIATAWIRWSRVGPEKALLDALSVVLISCPCALGIATPLAFWLALGEAWRRGVLVRGAEVLETIARARRILFDKTGTLTTGSFELREIHTAPGWEDRAALAIAAGLEEHSEHPIGSALRRASRKAGCPPVQVVDARALAGVGVEGRLDGRRWRIVRSERNGHDARFTRVALEDDDGAVADFVLAARTRPEAKPVLDDLRGQGLELGALTGDSAGPAACLSEQLGIPVEHSFSPEDKVRAVASRARTVFVGDGLNDSAALAAAETGISVSGGVERSLEKASVNLLRPGLSSLPELFRLSRRALRVARWNLVWAFAYNGVGLWLAATGRLSPEFAACAMVASSVFVVLHSRRVLAKDATAQALAAG